MQILRCRVELTIVCQGGITTSRLVVPGRGKITQWLVSTRGQNKRGRSGSRTQVVTRRRQGCCRWTNGTNIALGLLVVLIAIGKSSNCTALRATAEKVGLAMEIGRIVTEAASVARGVAGSGRLGVEHVVNCGLVARLEDRRVRRRSRRSQCSTIKLKICAPLFLVEASRWMVWQYGMDVAMVWGPWEQCEYAK